MIGLVSPVAWNVYDVCPSDVYLQVRQFFPHGYEPQGWLYFRRLATGIFPHSANVSKVVEACLAYGCDMMFH